MCSDAAHSKVNFRNDNILHNSKKLQKRLSQGHQNKMINDLEDKYIYLELYSTCSFVSPIICSI